MLSTHAMYAYPGWRPWYNLGTVVLVVLFVLSGRALHGQAQTFDSGSNGSDGALNLTTPGTMDFDPRALGLDQDGDNVYHFTTITIGAETTVRLSARFIPGPVFWLASGAVVIDGIIDLNGAAGQTGVATANESPFPAMPGAGGFAGGVGGTTTGSATAGSGPGGGGADPQISNSGNGAGHSTVGGGQPALAGQPYGNDFLVPLIGGSGGSGGVFITDGRHGNGGGAGGGALLIASSASLTVNGSIQANGGNGGRDDIGFTGGGGSGGAIHLLATTINVAGTLTALGGGGGINGSAGRIRIEGLQRSVTRLATPRAIIVAPFGLFLPTAPPPSLRVVRVDGVPVPSSPTGSFTMPDVTITATGPVRVDIEARNIPPGTTVQLHLLSDNAAVQVVDSDQPLAGTLARSTTTATVNVPSGFSRGFVRATWEQ